MRLTKPRRELARKQGLSLASAVVGVARALDLSGSCAEVVLLARR